MSTINTPVGYNVILALSDEVADRARQLSAASQQYGTSDIVLNHSNMLPHLTLCQCPIVGGVAVLKEALVSRLAQMRWLQTREFTVNMEHNFTTFMNTGVFWNASLGSDLGHMHKAVVNEMNKFRQGYILPHHAPMLYQANLVTEQQRASLSEWGSPLAMDQYLPHVTIGSMSDSVAARAAVNGLYNLPIPSNISFVAKEIAIAAIGPWGTCPKIVERISLV